MLRKRQWTWKKVSGLIILLVLLWGWYSGDLHIFQQAEQIQSSGGQTQSLDNPPPNKKKKFVNQIYDSKTEKRDNLEPGEDYFYLNGKPFTIVSGSFHYFRTFPEQWNDRFLRMRAAGLNTVTTYIPWNVHEKVKGEFTFSGRYDIAKFVQQAGEAGLYVIIRAGPYICAEWEFGGLPSWLLHDLNMIFRSSLYQPYLNYVQRYLSHLLPLLVPFTHSKGGPIIAFQLENEFLYMYDDDAQHIEFLKNLHEGVGIKEMLFIADNSWNLGHGALPREVYATINFGRDADYHFSNLRKFQPNKVVMATEFWPGWFDVWGGKHTTRDQGYFRQNISDIIRNNASFNLYMFVGGTNFEFFSGADELDKNYHAYTTSYNYDAPVSENGAVTAKYRITRDLIVSNKLVNMNFLPNIPADPEAVNYGSSKFDHFTYYDELIPIIDDLNGGAIEIEQPNCMEMLDINNHGGQGYGFILYRKNIKSGARQLSVSGPIRDRIHVIVNNNLIAIINNFQQLQKGIELELPPNVMNTTKENVLDLFVENRGRINIASKDGAQATYQSQTKGIHGSIEVDGEFMRNIKHVAYEFCDSFLKILKTDHKWKSIDTNKPKINLPTLFKGTFQIQGKPKDTFIDTHTWGRGVLFVNSFNLGRYSNEGPQKTLYVPAPVLTEGTNEVFVFEHEDATRIFTITFTDKPDLFGMAAL